MERASKKRPSDGSGAQACVCACLSKSAHVREEIIIDGRQICEIVMCNMCLICAHSRLAKGADDFFLVIVSFYTYFDFHSLRRPVLEPLWQQPSKIPLSDERRTQVKSTLMLSTALFKLPFI